MNEKRSGRILVVDDEEGIRTFIAESLERDGHEVVQAEDGEVALRLAREEPFDVVVSDRKMPKVDGMTLVRTLRTEQPNVELVILTAFGDVATAVEAMKLGVYDYLQKPIASPAAVRELVKGALGRRAELSVRSDAPPSQSKLTFGAPSMQPVVAALTKVAKSGATVLLQGESGSGKEAGGARAPRDERPRGQALRRHQLRGAHRAPAGERAVRPRGAFTGAHAQRRGRIELADGGTFFLDGGRAEAVAPGQALRVLQERTSERLGGSQPITVDVRWVAASHRDLRAMVREGTFREDLYHRLAVFPIRLPPLRSAGRYRPPGALAGRRARDRPVAAPRLDEALERRASPRRRGPATCASSATRSSAP